MPHKRLIPPRITYVILALALSVLACALPAGGPTADNTARTDTPPVKVPRASPAGTVHPPAAGQQKYRTVHQSDPERSVVSDLSGQWLATFTNGAYTVTLAGPERTFTDPNGRNPVVSHVWVRTLPRPFDGQVDQDWLNKALADSSPDIFAIAMQYTAGAPLVQNGQGLQIAGPASYGPVKADDTREEGGDFNDYLGVAWKFGGKEHAPKADFLHSLDCSGFMRLVWGYRGGLPLSYSPDGGQSIPRHSWEILANAPGVVVIADDETQVSDFSKLEAGDLVFFHAKKEEHDPQIDHVGLFLGKDSGGHYRFISSRQTINGPTFGDVGGASLLDGGGLYAKSFRAARRF